MSTLRISNIEAKSVPASATIDEKVKITNSSGDTLVFIDGKTSGITTVGINTTDGNITFDANSNIVVTGIITATRFSGQITPTSLEIGSNIKLGNAGVITATSFVGSGANLTNLPAQVNITGNADNRVITGGSGTNLNGESNLTFDGTSMVLGGGNSANVLDLGSATLNRGISWGGASYNYTNIWSEYGAGSLWLAAGLKSKTTNTGFFSSYGGNFARSAIELECFSGGGIKFFTSGAQTVAIDGAITVDERLRIGSDGKITVAANSDIRFTNGTWTGEVAGKIQHNSNNLYIQGGTGGIRFRHSSSGVNQFSMTNGGNFEITDGDLVVASGHGINFSATSNAPFGNGSNRQELLDDYEEGQWVPEYSATSSAGSVSYSYRKGYYIKIGAQVTVWIEMSISSCSGMSGDAQISNLPFNKNDLGGNGADGSGTYYYSGTTNWYIQYHSQSKPIFTGWMPNNTNVIRIYNGNDWGSIVSAPINTNGRMSFSYTYTSSA